MLRWLALARGAARSMDSEVELVVDDAAPAEPEPVPELSYRHKALIELKERMHAWYPNLSMFHDIRHNKKLGISARTTKQAMPCGNRTPTEVTFLEYLVHDVRPVDVFNVLADCENLPKWDSALESCRLLHPSGDRRARGFRSVAFHTPLSSRPLLVSTSWQMAAADFAGQNFYLVESSLGNDELQLDDLPPVNSVEAYTCFNGMRINADKQGVRVTQAVQLASANDTSQRRDSTEIPVLWLKELRGRSKDQFAFGWNVNSTVFPSWLLNEGCKPQSPTRFRTSVLSSLRSKLAAQAERVPSPEKGMVLERFAEQCGAAGAASIHRWRAKFDLPASPRVVFSALANPKYRADWDPGIRSLEENSRKSGARGFRWHLQDTQDILQEWQVGWHDISTGVYLLASRLGAADDSPNASNASAVDPCDWGCRISAAHHGSHLQCLLPPSGANGSSLAKTVAASLQAISERLTRSGRDFQALREQGAEDTVLELLVPAPTAGQNPQANVSDVLDPLGSSSRWRNRFSYLDVASALDTTKWTVQEFPARALDLLLLLTALRDEWTEQDAKVLASGQAKDQFDVQEQGEILGRLQQEVYLHIKAEECRPSTTPEPDTPVSPGDHLPWSLSFLVDIGTVILGSVMVLTGVIAHSVWRQKRAVERRATWAAEEFDQARAAGSVVKRMDDLWTGDQELSSPAMPYKGTSWRTDQGFRPP